MELTFNDDQLQFRDTVRRFLSDRADSDLRHAPGIDQRRDVWAAMAQLGVQGLAVPECRGGFSGAPEDIAVIAFELGREPVGTLRYENVVLAARLLDQADNDEADALAGRLACGDLRPAFAAYETPTCFDLAQTRTRIARIDGGYRIDGTKIVVIEGDDADVLLVVGRMEDDGCLAVLAVDPAADGITMAPGRLADFTPFADIQLEAVHVPEEALLFSGAEAAEKLQDCLDEAVVTLCAAMVGSLERAIERVCEFLRVREQFGRPLAQFQALQQQVATLFIQTNDARSIVYGAIAALHQGRVESRRAAAACKVKVASTAKAVAGQALHLHGGIGFTTEYPIGHHFRRAFVDERILGDIDHHFELFLDGS